MLLTINREKTSVLKVERGGDSLDFLGFTFRYDRSLYPWLWILLERNDIEEVVGAKSREIARDDRPG